MLIPKIQIGGEPRNDRIVLEALGVAHSLHGGHLFDGFIELVSLVRGRRFGSDAEAIDEVEHWFLTQTSDFYFSGINALQKRLTKCIELNGDYVEKN